MNIKLGSFFCALLTSISLCYGGGENLNEQLVEALNKQDIRTMQSLIEDGASVNACNEDNFTILMAAAMQGNNQAVQLLLEFGADKNTKTKQNQTALMLAAYSGHTAIVKVLIEAGADTQATDINGTTAKMYALLGNHKDIAEFLDQAPAPKAGFKKKMLYLAFLWLIFILIFIISKRWLNSSEKIQMLPRKRLYHDVSWSLLLGFLFAVSCLSFFMSNYGLAYSCGHWAGNTLLLNFFYFFFWWWKPEFLQDKLVRNVIRIFFYLYCCQVALTIITGLQAGLMGLARSIFALIMVILVSKKYLKMNRLFKALDTSTTI